MFRTRFARDFSRLGIALKMWLGGQAADVSLERAVDESYRLNPFFTPYMQRRAIGAIADAFLEGKALERWLSGYEPFFLSDGAGTGTDSPAASGSVGIIMAGNIPLVGFHDFLCAAACGRRVLVKLSSKDCFLLPALFDMLCRIDGFWRDRVRFVREIPREIDALIATGSGETAEKVRRKYCGIPMLVRGRRFSYAVLSGGESERELDSLAEDVFLYFGLGCRSVGYLLVPEQYDFSGLNECFGRMRTLVGEPCYMNAYKRSRSILKMEGAPFIDGGFYLLRECGEVFLPPGMIGFMRYGSREEIARFEMDRAAVIQKKYRTFGAAQRPSVDEYADGIDTMKFILNVNR